MEHGGWLRKACLSNIFPLSENHSTRSLINDFRQFCLWRQVTKEFRRSLARVIFDMKMFSQKYYDGTSVIVSVTVMKVYTWRNVPVTMYSVRYIALENNTLHYFAILGKNLYPEYVLDMLPHSYVTKAVEGNDTRPSTGVEQQELPRHYFKIPYIGYFSGVAQRRVRKLISRFSKPIDIKFAYSNFKIKNLFNVKDLLSDRLHTRIVNKFSCPSCDSCYVDETSWHFSMRVHEHMSSDRSSHVYKHLQASESRRTSCNLDDSVKGGYWSRFMENKMAVSHFTDNKFGISRFTRKKPFHTISFSYFG